MDTDKIATPDHQRRLKAAEIALGLVDAQPHDQILRGDPALRDEVARWQQTLSWLADELPPVPPPKATWAALKARIDDAPSISAGGSRSGLFAGLMTSLNWWRGLAGTGLVATAALAVSLVWRTPELVQAPIPATARSQIVLVSSLLPKDGPPIFVVSFDVTTATIIAIPATQDAVRGGIPQLWLVPKEDGDPIALGALALSRPSRIVLRADVAAYADRAASLVITLEPAAVRDGDSGRGPVIAHGVFVEP